MRVSRSPAPASRQRDRWTTSYADFVTILLVLFVALAAQGLQSAGSPPPPLVAPKPALQKPPAILTALAPLEKKGVKLKVEARGIVISLDQKILFDSGDDRVSDEALPVVSEIADVLRGIPNRVNLIGHADSRPVHSNRFRDNWELSVQRALTVTRALEASGMPHDWLFAAGFGDSHPIASNATADDRAQNRRVEIAPVPRLRGGRP